METNEALKTSVIQEAEAEIMELFRRVGNVWIDALETTRCIGKR